MLNRSVGERGPVTEFLRTFCGLGRPDTANGWWCPRSIGASFANPRSCATPACRRTSSGSDPTRPVRLRRLADRRTFKGGGSAACRAAGL